MKVAHLIMAYKNPKQLERLTKRLDHPCFDIFIHLDRKIDIGEFEHLKDLPRVYFIEKRVRCNWGGFSFVKAIIASMKEILEREEEYEFINLLSAQDYPIKPVNEFYDYLLNNSGKSFISYDELGKSDWWEHAVSRFQLYHFTDINIKGRYFLQKVLNSIAPKRKFPISSFKMYGCAIASWWTLDRDCAQYVISFANENDRLMRFMKYTWAADEFLFPTIIMNSPLKELTVNDNLRHIEWEEGRANPKILKKGDLEELMNSSKYFARKFDIVVDEEILDEIDQNLNI